MGQKKKKNKLQRCSNIIAGSKDGAVVLACQHPPRQFSHISAQKGTLKQQSPKSQELSAKKNTSGTRGQASSKGNVKARSATLEMLQAKKRPNGNSTEKKKGINKSRNGKLSAGKTSRKPRNKTTVQPETPTTTPISKSFSKKKQRTRSRIRIGQPLCGRGDSSMKTPANGAEWDPQQC